MIRIVFCLIPAALFAQIADPGAPPLSVSDKLVYHAKRIVEPSEFLRVGVSAGFQQLLDSPKEWGQGAEGYGRRYASSFGTNILRQSITFGLVAVTREDPRFFRSGETGFAARVKSAVAQTLICHTDSGGRSFAIGRVGGAFGSELLSNRWRAKSVDSPGDAMVRASSTLAVTAGTNVFREFLPEIKKMFKH